LCRGKKVGKVAGLCRGKVEKVAGKFGAEEDYQASEGGGQ